MHKLMCTFMTPMKKKKIPDRNLDTSCPAGIPCNEYLISLPSLLIIISIFFFYVKIVVRFYSLLIFLSFVCATW